MEKSRCADYPNTLLRYCARTCGCLTSEAARVKCNNAIQEDVIARQSMLDLCSSDGYESADWYYADDDDDEIWNDYTEKGDDAADGTRGRRGLYGGNAASDGAGTTATEEATRARTSAGNADAEAKTGREDGEINAEYDVRQDFNTEDGRAQQEDSSSEAENRRAVDMTTTVQHSSTTTTLPALGTLTYELTFEGTSCREHSTKCTPLRFSTGLDASKGVFLATGRAATLARCGSRCSAMPSCAGVYIFPGPAGGNTKCRGLLSLGSKGGKPTSNADRSYTKVRFTSTTATSTTSTSSSTTTTTLTAETTTEADTTTAASNDGGAGAGGNGVDNGDMPGPPAPGPELPAPSNDRATTRKPSIVLDARDRARIAAAAVSLKSLVRFCGKCVFATPQHELIARRMQLESCRKQNGQHNSEEACAAILKVIGSLSSQAAAQEKIGGDLDAIEAGSGGNGFASVGLLKLDIFFEHLNVETYTTEPKTSLAGVLSSLGGNFGLLLGFSIATMVEFVEFMLIHIFHKRPKQHAD